MNPKLTMIRRGLVLGLLAGALWLLVILNSRLHFWQKSVYDRLYVGMSRDEAVSVLRSANIHCGLTETIGDSAACHFSDAWYEYLVSVDSGRGTVSRKQATRY
jgi:hypothetical protein